MFFVLYRYLHFVGPKNFFLIFYICFFAFVLFAIHAKKKVVSSMMFLITLLHLKSFLIYAVKNISFVVILLFNAVSCSYTNDYLWFQFFCNTVGWTSQNIPLAKHECALG
jgi:hypothetical protein